MKDQNITLVGEKKNHRGNTQGWVQTDKAVHQALWKLTLQMPSANAVLHFMISRMSRGTNGILMSYEAIASTMGLTKPTVMKAIQLLYKQRFIDIVKSGNQNIYVINTQVAWQGERGKRSLSFHANIMVIEAEQNRPVDELIEQSKSLKHVPILEHNERMYVTNEEIPPPDQKEMDLP